MEQGEIVDPESYGSAETFGFKEICMKQVQRVAINLSKELRKGFVVKFYPNPNAQGEISKYISDTRREAMNSINVLHDLVNPKFDDKMKEKSKEIYKKVDEWKKKYFEDNKEKTGKFWDKVLVNYRELFQELCLFLDRIGWLESGGLEE